MRPPNLSKVAAVPVPVPRRGPGNDSGVNAYMIAYSIRMHVLVAFHVILKRYQVDFEPSDELTEVS